MVHGLLPRESPGESCGFWPFEGFWKMKGSSDLTGDVVLELRLMSSGFRRLVVG